MRRTFGVVLGSRHKRRNPYRPGPIQLGSRCGFLYPTVYAKRHGDPSDLKWWHSFVPSSPIVTTHALVAKHRVPWHDCCPFPASTANLVATKADHGHILW